MSLPSQSSSSVRSRANMYRRSRSKGRPVLRVVLFVAILSFVTWYLLPFGDDSSSLQPAQSLGQLPLEGDLTPNGASNLSDGATPRPAIEDPTIPNEVILSRKDETTPSVDPPSIVMGANPASVAVGDAQGASSRPPRTVLSTITPQPNSTDRLPTPRDDSTATVRMQQLLRNGWDQLSSNRLVEARRTLSLALAGGPMNAAETDQVRQALSDINRHLVFSSLVMEGDRYAMNYTIKGGDLLSSIVKRFALQVDWRFIQRINGIANPSRIRAGQRIKLTTGPFHAVIHKSSYRLDLYMGEEEDRVFVCSYPVGLGEYDSTPVGIFRIRPNSKLIDPQWTDPRTGRVFTPDDPKNPIGERWLGLEGLDEQSRGLIGYGIHGTIEPDSIGRQASMGCIRMLAEDVEIIYEVLMEAVSMVEIRND